MGETQRQEFHLMLEGSPPHFTIELKSSRVMDGEEIKFACTVVGNPMPNITWYKNGKVIVDNPDFLTTYDKKSGQVTLHGIEVFPQDTGEYRCIAVNQFGRAVTGATLQVDVFEYIPDSEEASASAAESLPERIVSEDEVEFIERTQAFIANMQKLRQELEQEHVEEDIIEMHEEYHEETVQMADVKWQKKQKKHSILDIQYQQEWTEDVVDTDSEISQEHMIQQRPFERGALRVRPQMKVECVVADISAEEVGLEEVRSDSPQQHEQREIMTKFDTSSVRRRPEQKIMPVEEIVSLDEIGFDEIRCKSPETPAESEVLVQLAKSKKAAPRGSFVKLQEQVTEPQIVEESQDRIPSPEEARDQEIIVELSQPSIESAKAHFTGYVEEHNKPEEEEDIFFESTEPELQGTNVYVALDMALLKEKEQMQSITQQTYLELTETECAQTEYDEEESKEEQIQIITDLAAKEQAKPSLVGISEDIVQSIEAEGFEVEMTEETSEEKKVEVILDTHATEAAKPSLVSQTEENVDVNITEESIEALTDEESTKEEISVDLSAAHKEGRPLTQAPFSGEDVPPEGIAEEHDANIKEIRLIPGVELPSYEPAVVESYRLETRVKWQIDEEENLIDSPFLVEDEAASMVTKDATAEKAVKEGHQFQTQSMKMKIEAAEDKKIEQVAEQALEEVSPSVKLMAAKAAEQVVRAAQEVTEEKEVVTETITDEIEVVRPIIDEDIIPDINQDVRMKPKHNAPPAFTEELKNMTVSDGDKVLMECKVTGYPRPQIKWFVDGMELSPSEDFQMTYNEDGYVSLYINDALPEDEGEYLVEAYNFVGKCESTAYLTVIHSIGTSPEPIEGQYAQQKTREHLVQQSMKKMEIDIEMQKQKQISIVEVPIPAQPAAPKFIKELETKEIYQTMPVTLECHVSGNPKPDIMWYQDGKKLTSTKHIQLEYNHGVCKLHIDRATVEDEAEYVCEARNEHGMQSTMSELLVENECFIEQQKPETHSVTMEVQTRSLKQKRLEGQQKHVSAKLELETERIVDKDVSDVKATSEIVIEDKALDVTDHMEIITEEKVSQVKSSCTMYRNFKRVKVNERIFTQIIENEENAQPKVVLELITLPNGEHISAANLSNAERKSFLDSLPRTFVREEKIDTINEVNAANVAAVTTVKNIKVGNRILTQVLEQNNENQPRIISEIVTLPSGEKMSPENLPVHEKELLVEFISNIEVQKLINSTNQIEMQKSSVHFSETTTNMISVQVQSQASRTRTRQQKQAVTVQSKPIAKKDQVEIKKPKKVNHKIKKAMIDNRTVTQVIETIDNN